MVHLALHYEGLLARSQEAGQHVELSIHLALVLVKLLYFGLAHLRLLLLLKFLLLSLSSPIDSSDLA